jgi:SAM-dependent methyltransferase
VQQDETTAVLSQSFGAVADDYDRLRSAPPDDALDWLLPAGATDALEIGAGTGLFTRKLAERVPHVTALEPDARMRAVLVSQSKGVEILEGRAEELPAADASYDVVTAQSAWHWVEESRAIPEVARVLRPGGRLALVWNGTNRSIDWMRDLWAGGVALEPEDKSQIDRRGRHRHHVDELTLREWFIDPETKLFTWSRTMTKDELIGLAATYSAVIAMDDEAKAAHLAGMRRYLDMRPELAQGDHIEVPMRAFCWRAQTR